MKNVCLDEDENLEVGVTSGDSTTEVVVDEKNNQILIYSEVVLVIVLPAKD